MASQAFLVTRSAQSPACFPACFANTHVFAVQLPAKDPFGVVQYGYPDSQIPNDPVATWNQNCEGKDFATAHQNSLQQDPNTGEPIATTPEICSLIQSTAQAGCTLLDPANCAPAGSTNPDNGSAHTQTSRSGDIFWLQSGPSPEFDGVCDGCKDPVTGIINFWISSPVFPSSARRSA